VQLIGQHRKKDVTRKNNYLENEKFADQKIVKNFTKFKIMTVGCICVPIRCRYFHHRLDLSFASGSSGAGIVWKNALFLTHSFFYTYKKVHISANQEQLPVN